jgi:predicted helicase
LNSEKHEIASRFNLKDSRDWKIEWAKKDLADNYSDTLIQTIMYRPFDYRYTFYSGRSKGFIGTPGYSAMKHIISGENTALIMARQFGGHKHFICFITNKLIEISSQPYAPYTVFPLFIYPDAASLNKTETRRPNLNMEIVKAIAAKTGLSFADEKNEHKNSFAPIDLLDYCYAILYSNKYRRKYAEFLKIDFPRVPHPANAQQFQKLVAMGSLLRNAHLMENLQPAQNAAKFPLAGTNEIEAVSRRDEKVFINKTQYFDSVPAAAWNYYIGGCQPAQKWLKDRKGRTLSFEDVEHYQKIISALAITIDIQAQIDEIEF